MGVKVLCLIAALAVVLVTVVPTSQQIRAAGPWYVAPSGDDGYACTSPGTACATINGAIAKASSGDTIYVAMGTYTGTGNVVVLLDRDLILSGGWDVTFTTQTGLSVIDGQRSRGGLRVLSGVSATVDRFSLRNGSGFGGGGIFNQGTLVVHDSIIANNSASQGGGIRNDGTLTVNNSIITNNKAKGVGDGGGICNVGIVTLNNSTVSGNVGGIGGGIGSFYGSSTLILNNSTVSGNTSQTSGGGIYGEGLLTLSSSTVSGNTASGGGGIQWPGGPVTLRNTLIAGNTSRIGKGPDCRGEIGTEGHNLIGDTSDCSFTPGAGDLTNVSAGLGMLIGSPGAPMYYPLMAGSPAIDAGSPSGCTDDLGNPLSTDQRGALRVGHCDIGAYEYTVPGPATVVAAIDGTVQHVPPSTDALIPLKAAVLDSIGSPVGAAQVTFTAPASGASGMFADSGTYTTTATTSENGVAIASTFAANEFSGDYVVLGTSGGAAPAAFLLSNLGWYVIPGGDDANSCQTPAVPCATVSGALTKEEFLDGDRVLVAKGTYTGTGNVVLQLDRDVVLIGGWDNSFSIRDGTSIIDGEGERRCLLVHTGATAVLKHFTIQNGLCDSSPGGGGIYNVGMLTLEDSVVANNKTDPKYLLYGGGIYSRRAVLTVNRSTIRDNTSLIGGGIHDDGGTVVLNNCTVTGNWANTGGGIDSSGVMDVNNSTIAGNTAFAVGGGVSGGGNSVLGFRLMLRHSIIAGNRSRGTWGGVDCYNVRSAGHNLIGDTTDCEFVPATGDLTDVDPRLGPLIGSPGHYPLLQDSPAIDAVPPGQCIVAVDQRGLGRPQGSGCDMGAYEYAPPGPAARIVAEAGTPQRTPPLTTFGTPMQVLVLDGVGSPVTSVDVAFSAPDSGASGVFADSGTVTTTVATSESGLASAPAFTANGQTGSYTVTAAVDGVEPASFVLSNVGWYVTLAGNDSDDCQTPATPCATVNGVLGKEGFRDGDTVLVAAGTYVGTGSEVVLLHKSARLLGGWDEAFAVQDGTSTIDGQGSRRGIYVDPDVVGVVERFTVQNGLALGDYVGGGIHNDGHLTLNHTVVTGNIAPDVGGALYNR